MMVSPMKKIVSPKRTAVSLLFFLAGCPLAHVCAQGAGAVADTDRPATYSAASLPVTDAAGADCGMAEPDRDFTGADYGTAGPGLETRIQEGETTVPDRTADRLLPAETQAGSQRSDSAIVAFLERTYGVKFTTNNRVVFFSTGRDKFADLFQVIRQARHTVHLEYFNFRNDSISRELFQLLTLKAAEGVKVRVLFDGFGNMSNDRPLKRRYLDSLRARGIEIYEFDPMRFPWLNHAFHRDHRKIVVIDGLVAYTGGMNVADYYLYGKPEFGEWRDVHLRVEGQAAGSLQAVFVAFWNLVTGQDVKGPELYPGGRDARRYFSGLSPDTTATAGAKLLGIVNKGPGSPRHIIRDTFAEILDGAQRQVQLISPYFTLTRRVRRALKRAARRGVDVQIMISAKSDIPITPRIVERNAMRLMKCGAEVWIYQGGFHHSKIMMVDSLYSFVGSANLNARSLKFDYECNVLVADAPSTRQLQALFEHDKRESCFLLTPEVWKKYPRWQRFKGWLFQIFTPFVNNSRRTRWQRAWLDLASPLPFADVL